MLKIGHLSVDEIYGRSRLQLSCRDLISWQGTRIVTTSMAAERPIHNIDDWTYSCNYRFFYASAFRRRRHYVFGLSVCLSIPPPVRPERFPDVLTHGRSGLKFGLVMYPDRLHNWLDCCYVRFIILILTTFWLNETGQIWVFRPFSGQGICGMACNLACWCILTTSRTD